MAVNIDLLTDDDIIDFTRSNGVDRVITEHRDVNLQGLTSPYRGGVYDPDMFGSPYRDRCLCGRIRRPSKEPCPYCGSRVLTAEEALKRYARIELPFYYLNELRFDIFIDFFNKIFEGCEIKLDFIGNDFIDGGYNQDRSRKKLGIKTFDTCQFDFDSKKKVLTISEAITDEDKCSYEGLLAIIEKHFPEQLTEFRKYINRYYLVLPSYMRPYHVMKAKEGGTKELVDKVSVWYCSVVKLCCPAAVESNKSNYTEIMSRFSTPGERSRYKALLRAFINIGRKIPTTLLNTSKKSDARNIYKVRVKNSARAPIIPDNTLAIDEVGIPVHVAYEMCREGFIKYLRDKLNFTKRQAEIATKYEAMNEETQRLFKEYAESQYIMVNRQPTLHEYGIYCCKLRLAEGDVIHFPISLCEPLNADFDGDTITVTLVPEHVAEDTYQRMSPRFNKIYKKSLKPIFVWKHEALNGANVATTYVTKDLNELENPKHYYESYADLIKDVDIDGKIKPGTPIRFTGKVGNLTYKNKITSYGRLRTSKIIGKDIDEIGIFKHPGEAIKAGSASKLLSYLYNSPDFVEKMNELQSYWLKEVTRAGVVTFDFKTLYVDTDTETYKKIREVADSKTLDNKEKLLLVSDLYAKYTKEIEGKFSQDLKNEIARANRVKIHSIMDINMPQAIVQGVEETQIVNRGSLLGGLTESEYRSHAVENRSLQIIKNSGVNYMMWEASL